MTESNDDIGLRRRLDDLVAKAKGDDTFAFSLKTDPEATLQAEGFSGGLLETLSRELGDAEVEGFLRCKTTCDPWTCIFTGCNYWTT